MDKGGRGVPRPHTGHNDDDDDDDDDDMLAGWCMANSTDKPADVLTTSTAGEECPHGE